MIDITNKEAVYNEICNILQTDFECDRNLLKPEVKLFEELDLDSIDAVDLIVKLQKTTGIKVTPEDFKQIRTLGDVLEVVYALLNKENI
ncbi:MAG: phosphopantetheine-binding protein [Deferribacteraceae bacterium]|nr:phosphopantetheine-binding protein [Deferribacteraceae bacterium]